MPFPECNTKAALGESPIGLLHLLSACNSEMMPKGAAATWQPAGKTNVKDSNAGRQEESGFWLHPWAAGPAWRPVSEHLVTDEK